MRDNHGSIRVDIQALRGLAVLLVVFYHARIGGLAAGYLGVDVFFVISGFLITTLVASGIQNGTFRLSDFYYRRAKRLLPAAYLTFFLSALLAPWFLNSQELRDFSSQMLGALTFTGNIVLWQQTGYFEGDGELKPLLHVWSLAIEEQYYFLLPAALLALRPQRWLAACLAAVVVSLLLCLGGTILKPIATFYLLPTRAWELLIGSVGALYVLRQGAPGRIVGKVLKVSMSLSLLVLVLLPFLPFDAAHPGLNAILICLATVSVILNRSHRLNSSPLARGLAFFGDFSYSLYLVHWPVIAFMRNAWVDSQAQVPLSFRLAAVVLSVILAYLLYRFVEDPVRRMDIHFSRKSVLKVIATSAVLAAVAPVAIYAKISDDFDFKELRRTNFGLSKACEFKDRFTPKSECMSSARPEVLLWGDSFAMHLAAGLIADLPPDVGLVQATKSQCAAFLTLAPLQLVKPEQSEYRDKSWAEACNSFNRSVLQFLKDSPAIHTVVLSSPFRQYVEQGNNAHYVTVGDEHQVLEVNPARAVSAFKNTVETLRALGKHVVVVAPPPALDFDIGGCLERKLSGVIAFGGTPDCVIDYPSYQKQRAAVVTFLNEVEAAADVTVIRFDPFLCDGRVCRTFMDGTMLYRDAGHLSYSGSEYLSRKMHLARTVLESAR